MSQTVGDFLVERLAEWGITHIYGFPGDGINGFLGALERGQDKLRFIQTRHEEMAAFMACAHAKFTGEVGVCAATSGPGAIHLLNGLYDAKLDHTPVVAIVGQTVSTAIGGDQQQEVDLLSLYKDVAAAYVQQVSVPAQMRHVIDRAMRIAHAERTVTAVIVPNDVQEMEAIPQQKLSLKAIQTGIGFAKVRVLPENAELDRAADILNAGEKVAMLVGAGALDATDEVLAAADVLGAGVAKALLGKAVIPDDVPFCTGSIGLLGTRASWNMMQECDTLFMVGSAFPYANFLPKVGKAKGVQIDISPRMLSVRFPMDVLLCGDSKATLQELLPRLRRKTDRSWQEKVSQDVAEWWRLMDSRAQPEQRNGRIRPQTLFSTLSEQLPDNAIISSDSGSAANWYARHVKLRRGMKASLSGNLATMLPGVPYAIAAKFAYPDRVAIAFVGDGAMQMGGMAEMLTAAKYYREWKDPRLIVLVLNNEDLNQVTWEQRVMEGDPKFEASQAIPYVAFDQWAEMIGLTGIKVDRVEQVESAWRTALQADRPVIINALTDPEEPPLPPHITVEQAKKFTESIVKGDPHGIRDAVTAMREKLDEFVPGR
ncbi:MAG: thiamine pyrophosphate-requiring protein [Candidatus Dormibacteraeota bacterium]|nr:thiamine pyrophosphate-requiring protein [Candidatus Dormibacteraeota bacterium]MBV9525429.1 thiamine pyrophosphate-requiring protein [Candidatus Dormibacteraeota bacterium]